MPIISRSRARRSCLMRAALLPLAFAGALAAATAMAASGNAAAPFELPPLVQPPSGESHPGKIVWNELVTPDLSGAKQFYGGVFGWTFNDIRGGDTDYSVALLDGVPVAGIVRRNMMAGERRQPAWLTFISVKDVDEAQRIVTRRGGKVHASARSYAQRGRQAVFSDPQGAVFAVLQSTSGDPKDELADPGEWIWASLLTADPDKDAGFYQALFGYEVFEIATDTIDEHMIFSSEDYARASANLLPAREPKLRPHWINFVRVTNLAESVGKALVLGGRVLVPAHADRHGGMVAIIADPAGAVLGLMDWTADSPNVRSTLPQVSK
jgi:predicted enzyme related to lactoylglutathione lyase